MKKMWIILGALAVVTVGGLIVWMVLGAKPQTSSNGATSGDTSNPTDTVDKTTEGTAVTVTIKNTKFTPQNIKVKKGTTVTWVNEDTVQHNVIAFDPDDQSGLPAQNQLFGNGERYSYTFEIIGTFQYKCSPHPFMTGSVEVVE